MESELLEKSRAYIDLSHKLDRFLTNPSDRKSSVVSSTVVGRNMSAARAKTLAERMAALNEKLKAMEESRYAYLI